MTLDDTERTLSFHENDLSGLNMSSCLRMCISRLGREDGISFGMKIDEAPANYGVSIMKRASRIAEEMAYLL